MVRKLFREMMDEAAKRASIPAPRRRRRHVRQRAVVAVALTLALCSLALVLADSKTPETIEFYVGFADRPDSEALLISIRGEGNEHALLENWNHWRDLAQHASGDQDGASRANSVIDSTLGFVDAEGVARVQAGLRSEFVSAPGGYSREKVSSGFVHCRPQS